MTNTFNRNDGTFAQVDYASISGTPSTGTSLSFVTNFTTADIAITSASTTNFVTGPFVTQGSSGTWFASGSIVASNSAGGAKLLAKLWDGASVMASGSNNITIANASTMITLAGVITSPTSNIKISVSSNSTLTTITFNASGAGEDCNVTAVRIA